MGAIVAPNKGLQWTLTTPSTDIVSVYPLLTLNIVKIYHLLWQFVYESQKIRRINSMVLFIDQSVSLGTDPLPSKPQPSNICPPGTEKPNKSPQADKKPW